MKKLNNTILWLHYKPKLVGKRRESEKIKIIVPFRSYTTHNRKFQKTSKKIRKTKQYHYGFFSSQNRLEKAEKEKKCKISFRSVPTRWVIQNSKEIEKKFEKLNNTIMASF